MNGAKFIKQFLVYSQEEAELVLVTGAAGFVASWIILGCFQRGFRVRGTVRNIQDEKKTQHLVDLARQFNGYIEFIEADLLSDSGWDAAVADCPYIFHVACPVPLVEPKNPDDVIKPAVDGTLRVLRSASRQVALPKRVVLTSSVTAMAFGVSCRKKVFTDTDWTCANSPKYPLTAYPLAKTLAEKAAWDFLAGLSPTRRFEMVSVNPTFAVGPMLSTNNCSSATIMRKILTAEIPGLCNMTFDMVSVIDVARVHLLVLTHPQAAGKRFLVQSTQISMQDMALVLKEEFSPHGYTPSTTVVPDWILRAVALGGDLEVKSVVPILGVTRVYDTNNMRTVLGFQPRTDVDAKGLILEMVYAGLHAGVIPDKSKNNSLSSSYVRPYFDIVPSGGSGSGSTSTHLCNESSRLPLSSTTLNHMDESSGSGSRDAVYLQMEVLQKKFALMEDKLEKVSAELVESKLQVSTLRVALQFLPLVVAALLSIAFVYRSCYQSFIFSA